MARSGARHAAIAALALLGCSAPGVAAAQHPYPSTPFALPDAPIAVALPASLGGPAEWGEAIWVSVRGQVLHLRAQPDGSLAHPATTVLAPDAVVTAMASSAAGNVFLDAAGERVLVHRTGRRRSEHVRSLAVGPEPSGMATDFASLRPWVMVANAGSGDLSLYVSRGGATFGAGRRIRVGSRPSAIVRLEIDSMIAVANSGSGTISHFASPEYRFGREPDVVVGGAPSALAVADSLTTDVNDDASDDLLVADSSAGTVRALLSMDRSPWFQPAGPFAVGAADAMVVADLDRDVHPDLAVTDRRAGRVLVLPGTRDGKFGAARVVASDLDPVGILAGQFGGDYQHDLLVADARSRAALPLLTPGDRRLSVARGARHLVAASGGRLLWSQPVDRRLHGLYLWSGSSSARLPIAASAAPLAARVGRLGGRPVVSYVRCRRGRCRAFAWDLDRSRERAVLLRIPRRCVPRQVQLWERRRAYVVGGGRGCRRSAKGLWIQRPPGAPRRVSATGRLGELSRGLLAFKDRAAYGWRIRIARAGEPTRTFWRSRPPGTDLFSVPQLDGGHVYWSNESVISERLILVRRPARRAGRCPEVFPGQGREAIAIGPRARLIETKPAADFALHGGRLFYIDRTGVFEADPGRVKWRRARC